MSSSPKEKKKKDKKASAFFWWKLSKHINKAYMRMILANRDDSSSSTGFSPEPWRASLILSDIIIKLLLPNSIKLIDWAFSTSAYQILFFSK